MQVAELMTQLIYRHAVESVSQTYYIFEAGDDHYLVASISKNDSSSGNFNIVNKRAVEFIWKKFGGKKNVTGKMVWDSLKKTKHPPSKSGPKASMFALRVLYILAAIDLAEYWMEGSHAELHFSIKKFQPAKAKAKR